MSHVLKHWREAATLLLVAKARVPVVTSFQTANFEVLMLKRSGKSKFMPKLHVFPGGVAHDSDFSPEWLELFSQAGNDVVKNMQSFLERGGKGAYMFSRTRPEEFSKIHSELAFRICAIRETFEESGILIARDLNNVRNQQITGIDHPISGKSSVLSDTILKPWRERVDNDASQFIAMCKELNLLPDIWSLYEWSNWLTPILPGQHGQTTARRYDTAFYLCVLDYTPNAEHCAKETTELEWTSASGFLLKHVDETNPLQLAPPQIVELGRILHFSDAEKLKQFSWERSACRVQCFYPVTCYCDDGFLFIYPGDDLYPETPDYTGEQPPMKVEGTVLSLRDKYPNMNRSEMTPGPKGMERTFTCNIKMADGQVSPLFIDKTMEYVPASNL